VGAEVVGLVGLRSPPQLRSAVARRAAARGFTGCSMSAKVQATTCRQWARRQLKDTQRCHAQIHHLPEGQ
jgi:hypothetical protein